MFYPSFYDLKLNKEQEIRELVQQAAIDRLVRDLLPRREGVHIRVGRAIWQYLLHSLNQRSAPALPKIELTRQSNAILKP